MNPTYRRILETVLHPPTAPFREQSVAARIRAWASKRRFDVSSDQAGNLWVRLRRGTPKGQPRWVFCTHMDHPGFVTHRQDGEKVWAQFRGGVAKEYFVGSKVRLYPAWKEDLPDQKGLAARVETCRRDRKSGFLLCRLALARRVDVPTGTIGMWDLPAMELRGGRIVSRACDDLVGVAAALASMQQLARSRMPVDVSALITRGEEAGFTGTLAACAGGSLPRDAWFVGIETSKAQSGAELGDGVVVRVGDRSWLFDPVLTGQVASVAAGLARQDRHFRYVRQLMPGGTCETTPLGVWGYRAAALCLPLANYHNQGGGGRIRAEAVDVGDFASLVKLLVAIGRSDEDADTARGQLKQRLKKLLSRREQLLEE